jgi:hypothetical protein
MSCHVNSRYIKAKCFDFALRIKLTYRQRPGSSSFNSLKLYAEW